MASGYNPDLPSDEKTPAHSPYPAHNQYPAPGYQQYSNPPPATATDIPSVSGHVQHGGGDDTPGTSADQQRRTSTDSQTSYDDIFKLTKPVEVTFKEVFQEAKGSESPKPVYKINTTVFTYVSWGMYLVLSVTLGIILSVVWGILFGVLNFIVTWLIQPALKVVFVLLRISYSIYSPLLRTFLDPFFKSWGYIFSKIRGGFNFNFTGLVWPKKEKRLAIAEEV